MAHCVRAEQLLLVQVTDMLFRTWRRKLSFHQVLLSLIDKDFFEGSRRSTSSVRQCGTAMLAEVLFFQLSAASSRKETSNCRSRAFSDGTLWRAASPTRARTERKSRSMR